MRSRPRRKRRSSGAGNRTRSSGSRSASCRSSTGSCTSIARACSRRWGERRTGPRRSKRSRSRDGYSRSIGRRSGRKGTTSSARSFVIGTGAGGAARRARGFGRARASRRSCAYVEEGATTGRDAFGGSSLDAHHRFYRAALDRRKRRGCPSSWVGFVGGSTAINGGIVLPDAPWVLASVQCDELRHRRFFAPRRDEAANFARVEDTLQVAPTERRFIGPIADVSMSRGCDALGWHHFSDPEKRPRLQRLRVHATSGVAPERSRGPISPTFRRRSFEGGLSSSPQDCQRRAHLLEGGRAVGVEGSRRTAGPSACGPRR